MIKIKGLHDLLFAYFCFPKKKDFMQLYTREETIRRINHLGHHSKKEAIKKGCQNVPRQPFLSGIGSLLHSCLHFTREETIRRINHLGQSCRPFIFIINYLQDASYVEEVASIWNW